jgi:hypothetical protein
MQNLGRITNHHLVVSDSELLMLINALAFFHATFDVKRDCSLSALFCEWEDVAKDTHLPSVDQLATRLASLDRA